MRAMLKSVLLAALAPLAQGCLADAASPGGPDALAYPDARILYDARPWADSEPTPDAAPGTPDGAPDGAPGTPDAPTGTPDAAPPPCPADALYNSFLPIGGTASVLVGIQGLSITLKAVETTPGYEQALTDVTNNLGSYTNVIYRQGFEETDGTGFHILLVAVTSSSARFCLTHP